MSFTIDQLVPPADRLPPYAAQGNFRRIGDGFVRAAVAAGLEPTDRVLDIGCGVGRFAVAFAAIAQPSASYEGLDAVGESIELCREHIGTHLPNFNFQVVPVHNGVYATVQEGEGADYRFPFEDASFDFVFSNSLFTHLLQPDTENYVREIGRVLRPGGTTLNTMFLLNEVSLGRVESGESPSELPDVISEDPLIRVRNRNRPESVIAYDETWMRELHDSAQLVVDDPIRYGSWSGREASGPGFGTKDIVVAQRRDVPEPPARGRGLRRLFSHR